jgi:hypothetical protein
VAETAYEASLSDAPVNLVRVLAEPRGATDDRRRVLAFLVYVGVVAGLAIGAVLIRLRHRGDGGLAGGPVLSEPAG